MGSILVINAGSSSLRFAAFGDAIELPEILRGKVERTGPSGADDALQNIQRQLAVTPLSAIAHRIVHGMQHSEPVGITPALVEELHRNIPNDPEHMPRQLEFIEACTRLYPGVPQVACFDTAFHAHMPRVAAQLPLPRRYEAQGLRRYGFHGLSYEYLLEELARVAGPDAAKGRVILAHLGNGASLAAVKDGVGIDTTMGFTPAGGLVMGTRTGDLDPGVAAWLLASGLNAEQFTHLVNHESGLLGISETSADVRDLLKLESTDARAAEALSLFCYQVRKYLGAFAAVLSGLDTLVFAGGIGENSPVIRQRICNAMQFLGLELDARQNAASQPLISSAKSRVAVRVIPTNEERMLARHAYRFLRK